MADDAPLDGDLTPTEPAPLEAPVSLPDTTAAEEAPATQAEASPAPEPVLAEPGPTDAVIEELVVELAPEPVAAGPESEVEPPMLFESAPEEPPAAAPAEPAQLEPVDAPPLAASVDGEPVAAAPDSTAPEAAAEPPASPGPDAAGSAEVLPDVDTAATAVDAPAAVEPAVEAPVEQPEASAPPEPVPQTMLIGSSVLDSILDIGFGMQTQLGEIVRLAHARSGLSVDAWNTLDPADREARLRGELAAVRAAVKAQDAHWTSVMLPEAVRDAALALDPASLPAFEPETQPASPAEPLVELPEDDPVEDLVIVPDAPAAPLPVAAPAPAPDLVRVLNLPTLVTLLGPEPAAPAPIELVPAPAVSLPSTGSLSIAADALRSHLARMEALTTAAQAFEVLSSLDQQVQGRVQALASLNASIAEAQGRVDAAHAGVLRARAEAEAMTASVNAEVGAIRKAADEAATQFVEESRQRAREIVGDAMADANQMRDRALAEAQDASRTAAQARAAATAASEELEAATAQHAIVEQQLAGARAKLRELLGE